MRLLCDQHCVAGAVVDAAHDKFRNRRLGEPVVGTSRSVSHNFGPGIGALIALVKDPVRRHLAFPLMRRQPVDLGPGPSFVIMRKAKRAGRRFSVQLNRVKTMGGHCMDASVIIA